MIAKKITAPKGGGRTAALVRYVVNAQGNVDPRSWTATADYILDAGADPNAEGEKVSAVRVTNCASDDAAGATMEIEATQALYSGRSKAPNTYHLVISFPPGEQPPQEALHDIEDELCKSIGLENHQRISAVHIDRDHYHVHVAINTVTEDGKKIVQPYQDMPRLMKACEALEIKHGLERTNHGLEQEPRNERNPEVETQRGPNDKAEREIEIRNIGERDTRFRRYLRECHNLALGGWGGKAGDDLHQLPGSDVVSDEYRSTVLVLDDAAGAVVEGPAPNAENVRWAGESNRGVSSPAKRGIEEQAGIQTLAGYVAREVGPALRDALTWQEAHDALADHGLTMKKRGAGLVIGDAELGLWCKASSVDRDFSLKSLEQALGPFEASTRRVREAGPDAPKQGRAGGYRPAPLAKSNAASDALYSIYQKERQAAAERRRVGLVNIRQQHSRTRQEIKAWAASQRTTRRMTMKGPAKRLTARMHTMQAKQANQRATQHAAASRAALMAETSMPAWNDWLVLQAQAGNEDALGVLRARQDRHDRSLGQLFTADRADRAADRLLSNLKPEVRPNGTVAYRAKDGGMVLDRGGNITVPRNTPGACLAALEVMEAKFPGQPLALDGESAMAQTMAALAGTRGTGVTFADPKLEAIRVGAGRSTPQTTQPEVLEDYIGERRKTAAKISSILDYREWVPDDAGAAIYAGRRNMSDQSVVVLLERGDEMLVKPVNEAEAKQAETWKIGQTVEIDAQGHMTVKAPRKGRKR